MTLIEEAARSLLPNFDRAGRQMQTQAKLEARNATAIVMAKVEQHLSAVQYDPAPYTALKYRLRALSEDKTR